MGPDCRTCLSRSRHGLPDSCLGQCLCSGDLQVPGAPGGFLPWGGAGVEVVSPLAPDATGHWNPGSRACIWQCGAWAQRWGFLSFTGSSETITIVNIWPVSLVLLS